eukprot:MONOS_5044.1-p1 / transcript=MONOS_5044.1 / gene=MONOS_5044 / organism=Monocercomonoides_exilis_PA203 / gene_product=unspecified product / transcript_product=unspecified product / location=Mono_scaffold00142:86529-88722(-) / protein_length=710 / sequence_SO=supercontig / SO=protein_coding / is_pseudo=false
MIKRKKVNLTVSSRIVSLATSWAQLNISFEDFLFLTFQTLILSSHHYSLLPQELKSIVRQIGVQQFGINWKIQEEIKRKSIFTEDAFHFFFSNEEIKNEDDEASSRLSLIPKEIQESLKRSFECSSDSTLTKNHSSDSEPGSSPLSLQPSSPQCSSSPSSTLSANSNAIYPNIKAQNSLQYRLLLMIAHIASFSSASGSDSSAVKKKEIDTEWIVRQMNFILWCVIVAIAEQSIHNKRPATCSSQAKEKQSCVASPDGKELPVDKGGIQRNLASLYSLIKEVVELCHENVSKDTEVAREDASRNADDLLLDDEFWGIPRDEKSKCEDKRDSNQKSEEKKNEDISSQQLLKQDVLLPSCRNPRLAHVLSQVSSHLYLLSLELYGPEKLDDSELLFPIPSTCIVLMATFLLSHLFNKPWPIPEINLLCNKEVFAQEEDEEEKEDAKGERAKFSSKTRKQVDDKQKAFKRFSSYYDKDEDDDEDEQGSFYEIYAHWKELADLTKKGLIELSGIDSVVCDVIVLLEIVKRISCPPGITIPSLLNPQNCDEDEEAVDSESLWFRSLLEDYGDVSESKSNGLWMLVKPKKQLSKKEKQKIEDELDMFQANEQLLTDAMELSQSIVNKLLMEEMKKDEDAQKDRSVSLTLLTSPFLLSHVTSLLRECSDSLSLFLSDYSRTTSGIPNLLQCNLRVFLDAEKALQICDELRHSTHPT